MREIKFRGLNQETGEWVYGWYTKLVEGIRRFDAIITEIDGELTRLYIHNKETIGQFTGLHDKNGKEIYEGDVVKYARVMYGKTKYFTTEVIWNNGFILKENNTIVVDHFVIPAYKNIEVIGNIHEASE